MTSLKNSKSRFFAIFLITVSSSWGDSSDHSQAVELVFKRESHQNPWLIREPIRKQTPALRISKNRFITLTLPNENPLYAELIHSNHPNGKLEIQKYDPSTGFMILQGNDEYKSKIVNPDSRRSRRVCKFQNSEYIHFSFSEIPIRAYKIGSQSEELKDRFLYRKNEVCGLVIGNYLIPIEYFAKFKSPDFSAFPHPGFSFEANLNSSERSFYFPKRRKGILVKTVYPGVGPNFQLLPGDAIYEINGIALAGLSDVGFRDRVLDLLLRNRGSLKSLFSSTRIKFMRNGVDHELSYSLKPFRDDKFLVPNTHPYGKPPYFITGGLFFTELTAAYLKEFGDDYRKKSEKKLLYILESFHSKSHPHRDRVVILSRILPHPNNKSYQTFQDLILNRVNGEDVRNLKNLKTILKNNRREFIEFEFTGQKSVVFRRDELSQIDYDILKSYKLKTLDNIGE